MTPKFRIYDKQEEKYCEEDAPLMLCMDGFIFDRADEDWYTVGERYIVEFQLNWKTEDGYSIHEGDILSCTNPNDGEEYITSFGVNDIGGIYFNDSELSFELSMYEYLTPNSIKIIGTIHDEKYKIL